MVIMNLMFKTFFHKTKLHQIYTTNNARQNVPCVIFEVNYK